MNLENLLAADWLGHWIVVVFLVVLATALVDMLQRTIIGRLEQGLSHASSRWDDAIVGAVKSPLSVVIWVYGLTIALGQMPMDNFGIEVGAERLAQVREVGLILGAVWFVWRIVGRVEKNVVQDLREGKGSRGQKMDEITAQGLGRLARVAVLVTGLLVMLDTIGVSISGLLAAGGIGGIAIGLAGRDMLANFFGGLTIFMDKPFKVGDWVRSPDREIEGFVQHIGWRQTVIRTFDKRPLYVPNSIFTTIVVENPERMTHRRIKHTVGIRYDDFGVIEPILKDLRAMLEEDEEVDTEQLNLVNFHEYGSSSLDIFVYCFCADEGWVRFLEVQEKVLLKIGQIIEKHGAEIAFPTRHLKYDEGSGKAGPETGGSESGREDSKAA